MELLSHPFRLERNGSVATVTDGTDEANAEGIAVLALTRKGERDLVPDFGLTDPAFDSVTLADLNIGLLDYGPTVEVTDVTFTYPNDWTQRVVLAFDTDTDADEE